MRRIGTAFLLLGLVLPGLSARATTAEDVQSFILDNGMKIMVLEDDSIPNANMYLFWKVGSRNERPGITGISHFFEHMMFNGAKKYGPKMFDRTMEAAGGSNNAYTTENMTVYFDGFPTDALELIFELEADRIADLAIDPKMVASERQVVMSEWRTGRENSNWELLESEVKGCAFRAHPYSWPVIGHESDIAAWTQEDLEQYHQTYYAPNNAVVVISGNVTLERVKQLADQYFAPIPAQVPPLEVSTVEPEQQGERRVFVKKESVSSPNVMLVYHVPETGNADYYALELLTSILGEGNSSRLSLALVDQQIALEVETYMPMAFDPNLLYVFGVAAPEVSAETLELAMIHEINRIAAEGVTSAELEKVRNIKLMDFYRSMETINGKSEIIGTYELYFGSCQKLFDTPQAYAAVTPEDIQRVAQTYLCRANRTVGVLAAEEETDPCE